MKKTKYGLGLIAVTLCGLLLQSFLTEGPAAQAATLETFEGDPSGWQVNLDTSGGASVTQSSQIAAAEGLYSARTATSGSGQRAQVRVNFADAASSHTWEEHVGTWYWQQASVYVPSATVAQLTGDKYLTLAGLWTSSGGNFGWYLRLRQGGAMYVQGYTDNGSAIEFPVNGTFPQDRWVELELGLNTQAGPGVKRAFSFLIDGNFYGWYRQGRMSNETYDRAAMGILATNSSGPLSVFIDQWRTPETTPLPTGPDKRSTSSFQAQDFRNLSGLQVQYDWSTWQYSPTLDPQHGLYSQTNRLQAGHNIDRLPSINSGWAEIEMDYSGATPNLKPTGYFGPMVGFRKDVNREENLEVIPYGQGNGQVNLLLEAWVGGPTVLAQWPLPISATTGSAVPEPGDIIRVRWQELNATTLNVRASYYDASIAQWNMDVISGNYAITNVSNNYSNGPVNFMDGYHTASSITIDSTAYSIRRYGVGTLDTYPCTANCNLPVSVLNNLSPRSVNQGAGDFDLTVGGLNFSPLSQVYFNGINYPTNFVNSTQLIARISASAIATTGTASIRVQSPDLPNYISSIKDFFIYSNCTPTLVNRDDDTNSCGSLRYAINNTGGLPVLFDTNGPVTVTGTLLVPPNVQLQAGCVNRVRIILSSSSKLQLQGSNLLQGIILNSQPGAGVQIQANPVKFQCSVVKIG